MYNELLPQGCPYLQWNPDFMNLPRETNWFEKSESLRNRG